MRAALAAGLGLAAVAWLAAFPQRAPETSTDTALPAISFQDDKGRTLDLAAFRGKVVLLDYWATWCVPCRKEIPAFDRLQERYGARGLAIAPVSIDARGLEAVAGFYRELGVRNLPQYVDDTREGPRRLGFVGIPSAIAFDRRGHEAFRVEGPIDWGGPAVAARLELLLAQP